LGDAPVEESVAPTFNPGTVFGADIKIWNQYEEFASRVPKFAESVPPFGVTVFNVKSEM
jgi:hypothetical protein